MRSCQKIIGILERAKAHITDDSDVVWTKYASASDFRKDIDSWIKRLESGDEKVLSEINFAFLPTSSFQEHAVSNGWGEEYLELAAQIDRCLSEKTTQKLKNEEKEQKVGCWRMLFAVLITPFTFFILTMVAVDGGSYEGALNALFLIFFIPFLSFVFVHISKTLHEMLIQFDPFHKVWKSLGVRVLLLSFAIFWIVYFSKEIGLQYQVTLPEEGNRTITAMPAPVLFALWFVLIYPIVNYVED